MRKVLISLAAAGTVLAFASPAAAQYYPVPQPQGYGYGYGQNDNWGHVRSLQVRIDNLQRRIARLDSRDRINEREARRLRDQARDLERRLRASAWNGLTPNEHARIAYRLQQIEARVFRDVRDGRNWDRRDRDDDRRWDGRGRDRDDDDDRRRRGRDDD